RLPVEFLRAQTEASLSARDRTGRAAAIMRGKFFVVCEDAVQGAGECPRSKSTSLPKPRRSAPWRRDRDARAFGRCTALRHADSQAARGERPRPLRGGLLIR